MKHYILLQIETSKPVSGMATLVAGRAYTLDGVEDAHVVEDKDGVLEAAFKQLSPEGAEPCRTTPTAM